MFKNALLSIICVSVMLTATFADATSTKNATPKSPLQKIIKSFEDADDGKVLVASHRGDHKNYPENSIAGIVSAANMGVDIVEIDVRLTSDGHLILMHDSTIDRTTNGKGKVNEMTVEEITKFRLKGPDGKLTEHKIPTAKDALEALRGRCLINLDKSEYCLEECIELAKKIGMTDQIIIKGSKNADKVKKLLDKTNTKIYYAPVILGRNAKEKKTAFKKYKKNIETLKPQAIEVVFYDEDSSLIKKNAVKLSDKYDVRVWCNSLFDKHGAGHVDKKAMIDPDANWGWIVNQGTDIIQTDEPVALLKYLKSKGLHD